ncbi:MAG: hypothetical protein IJ343_10285 [Clostridia bacterium]|nr:hypothetical protein [Clostridia bacterium]
MNQEERIVKLEADVGIIIAAMCTKKENQHYAQMIAAGEKLPAGVYPNDDSTTEFVRVDGDHLNDDERRYMVLLKIADELRVANERNAKFEKESIEKLGQLRFWVMLPYVIVGISLALALVLSFVFGVKLF